LFTMPVPVAVICCAVNPAWWPVLPVMITFRTLAAWILATRVAHARLKWPLLMIEDLAAFCFWVAGFFGNTITWRGRRYRLYSDGRFEPVPLRLAKVN
jgi:ceramide glucosyltransferase